MRSKFSKFIDRILFVPKETLHLEHINELAEEVVAYMHKTRLAEIREELVKLPTEEYAKHKDYWITLIDLLLGKEPPHVMRMPGVADMPDRIALCLIDRDAIQIKPGVPNKYSPIPSFTLEVPRNIYKI